MHEVFDFEMMWWLTASEQSLYIYSTVVVEKTSRIHVENMICLDAEQIETIQFSDTEPWKIGNKLHEIYSSIRRKDVVWCLFYSSVSASYDMKISI